VARISVLRRIVEEVLDRTPDGDRVADHAVGQP
jgi:hypothetical protein